MATWSRCRAIVLRACTAGKSEQRMHEPYVFSTQISATHASVVGVQQPTLGKAGMNHASLSAKRAPVMTELSVRPAVAIQAEQEHTAKNGTVHAESRE